jgi:hypothetical protein
LNISQQNVQANLGSYLPGSKLSNKLVNLNLPQNPVQMPNQGVNIRNLRNQMKGQNQMLSAIGGGSPMAANLRNKSNNSVHNKAAVMSGK